MLKIGKIIPASNIKGASLKGKDHKRLGSNDIELASFGV
jgi:hypothetical protein